MKIFGQIMVTLLIVATLVTFHQSQKAQGADFGSRFNKNIIKLKANR